MYVLTGIVGIFYLVFYSVLAVLCAICMMGLLASIDENRPKYVLESSIIGTNPGKY
jgi:sodium/potassium-transporting ATPase subunit beta